MWRALLFLGIIFLSYACEEERVAPQPLTGQWEWVRTDGGIANHIHDSPQSTGKTIRLVLNQNLTYRKFINGVLSTEGSYVLSKRTCIHDHQQKEVITFSADMEMMIESLDGQNLELSDENYDGLASRYRRAGGLSQE